MAPKVMKQLFKASCGYEIWKRRQRDPLMKPWVFPEQTIVGTRISLNDVRYFWLYILKIKPNI